MTAPSTTPPLDEREAVARTLRKELIARHDYDSTMRPCSWIDGMDECADAIIAQHIALLRTENETLRAERNAAIARAREPVGDPWDEIRRIEQACRDLICERNDWKAVANTSRAELAQAKAQVAGMRSALVSAEDALSDAASGLSFNDTEGRQNAGQALQDLRNFIARFEEPPHGE